MITNSNSLFRERDAQKLEGESFSMEGSEHSRVRIVFGKLNIPLVSPHPVQPNGKFFLPWPLWQFFSGGVSSGAHSDVASLGYTVRLLALLLPASSATTRCLAW